MTKSLTIHSVRDVEKNLQLLMLRSHIQFLFLRISIFLLMIFIVMNNGNGPPARIKFPGSLDGKLKSHLQWPYLCLVCGYLFDVIISVRECPETRHSLSIVMLSSLLHYSQETHLTPHSPCYPSSFIGYLIRKLMLIVFVWTLFPTKLF